MKVLKSTSKDRKRYILIKIKPEGELEKSDVSRLVIQAGLRFLGELGMARAGIQFVPESWNGSTGIVRVDHKYVDEAKSALAFVKDFEGKKAAVESVRVSGVINKLKSLG